MTFLIAAAGTGGHVYPGVAVGEALLDRGVARSDIVYVGCDRLEATVYPGLGFPFVQVEMRGLQRSLTADNLAIPALLGRARRRIESAVHDHRVRAVLGLGGYVTVPAAWAARRRRLPFFNSEQNAVAGLANRIASRWARQSFAAFPHTTGLPSAVWVGNPVRRPFWSFVREDLRPQALDRYGLREDVPVLGAVGGSLGAGLINEAITTLAKGWAGSEIQILHLTGERFHDEMQRHAAGSSLNWVLRPFEDRIELFYAVSDLVLARAGGSVAELTATTTPAVLIPGDFGSTGHQAGNARFLTDAGAAVTVHEREMHRLADVVDNAIFSPGVLKAMSEAAGRVAKPHAAHAIADEMIRAAT